MRFDGWILGLATAAAILTFGCARQNRAVNSSTATALKNDSANTNDFAIDETFESSLAAAASANFAHVCEGGAAHRGDKDVVALYGKACTAGDAESCTKLGSRYMCG